MGMCCILLDLFLKCFNHLLHFSMRACHISMEIRVSAVMICDRVRFVIGSRLDPMVFNSGVVVGSDG